MKIIVVGGTSLIAKHCIQQWASTTNSDFVLIGRNAETLSAITDDLGIRYPGSTFSYRAVDMNSAMQIQASVISVTDSAIDLVLIAHGSLTSQRMASLDLDYLWNELQLNATSVAAFCEAFAGALESQNHGTLGVIGSVAGDRGRAYNYSYGASKALIETYVQGLQQRLARSEVSVALIKPGPTATPMTITHSGRMANPQAVARVIVKGLRKKKRVIYAPKAWSFVMFAVRLIPFLIYKNLKF